MKLRGILKDRSPDKRGVSPVVGFALLSMIVMLAVALLLITGVPFFDAIEDKTSEERAKMYMTETDHTLSTVATTDDVRSIPVPPDADASIVDDGEMTVSWYNESTDKPFENGCVAPVNTSGELNALKYDLEDGTEIVHQAGGIWKHTDSSSTVISEPNIAYTNSSGEKTGSLRLQVMQFEKGNIGDSGLAAKANWDKTAALTEEIEKKGSCNGENIAFRIEDTTYQDAWYDYLEDALGANEYDEVEIARIGSDTVHVEIEGIRRTDGPVSIIVKEDRGIRAPNGDPIEPPVIDGSQLFRVATVIENVGDTTEEQQITATILDDGTEVTSDTESVKLSPGGTENLGRTAGGDFVQFEPGNFKHKLTYGETYSYTVATEDDELDDPGSFYYGKKGTEFRIVDPADGTIDPDVEDGNATIDLEVQNVGTENTTGEDITLEFDDLEFEDTQNLDLNYGASGTVKWEINKSTLPQGNNGFTVTVDGDEIANGTVVGTASGDGGAFVVVEDEGAGNDQIVEDDGTPFEVRAGVMSTYPSDNVTQDVTLMIPDAGIEIDEPTTLDSGESETVGFNVNPDDYAFEHGRVYEYDVQAEESSLNETGTFYFGHQRTEFELSNGNATVGDKEITITADLHNTGVDDGEQNVTLDLDLRDPPEDLKKDPYAEPIDAGIVNRSFGENDTVELPINQSVLVDGTYDATIETDDDKLEVTFNVTAGVDPGRVELEDIEDANVSVEVLASQVSGDGSMWVRDGWGWDIVPVHHLAPMTLEVVADGKTAHTFENPHGGNNINTGPTWQDNSDDSYTYEFTVKDETELTLRNTRYSICREETTDPSTLTHYDGPTDRAFTWCDDVPGAPGSITFGPIDASQDANLQNVRVRSAENNTIPALPAGEEQQLSATEVLEQRGLVEEGGNELDLGPGEFVFLFENTESTSEDDIDALWDEATAAYEENPDDTHDPNFNDLIVYVEVERAGVNPGKPSITIVPGDGNEADIDPGEGDEAGTPADPELNIDGEVDESDSPDIGAGDSDPDTTGTGTMTNDTNINIGSDNVILG